MKTKFRILLILLIAPAAAFAADTQISVSAEFEPAKVRPGENARYTLQISETSADDMPAGGRLRALDLPRPDGLEFGRRRVSTSQQTNIINLEAEYIRETRITFEVSADEPGTFEIPGYEFRYKDQTLEAPSTKLRVKEGAAADEPDIDKWIFLRADVPGQLYIGQIVPISLKLYRSDKVRIGRLEAFNRRADGFTVTELPDQPEEDVKRVDGRRYRVLSWPLALTAISTGTQNVEFQFTLTAQVPRERGSGRSRRHPGAGNSLFDELFGRTERFTVYSDTNEVEVLPLPDENRPAAFSGGIGDFSIEVFADKDRVRVGEPMLLSLIVSGEGNFDRISAPELPDSNQWRVLDVESTTDREEPHGISGSKRFDYTVVPRHADAGRLPEVPFAFFDPSSEEYVSLDGPRVAVEIEPSPHTSGSAAPQRSSEAPDRDRRPSAEEELFTLDYQPEPARNTEPTLLKSPVFHTLNVAAALALAGAFVHLRKNRRLRTDPGYALVHKAAEELKSVLAEAARAEQNNDAAAFYDHAQKAVRLAATKRTGRDLRAAHPGDLEQHLRKFQYPRETLRTMETLFRSADNFRFSGRNHGPELTSARRQLDSILKVL